MTDFGDGKGILFLGFHEHDVRPFSYMTPPRIRFIGVTRNWIPCKCILPRGEFKCAHSPVLPRVTTIKGEA